MRRVWSNVGTCGVRVGGGGVMTSLKERGGGEGKMGPRYIFGLGTKGGMQGRKEQGGMWDEGDSFFLIGGVTLGQVGIRM
mmetsp:Transcript_19861/g.41460  ORF Transcript_19861/g.41460 Transcript_19861/m.41460 type:complete len:80 (+) Transcript_19861:208-447(+)|eukprot:CAMPEP_0118653822 /NCGR_PEP_ID=MMETSP0785-20121206/12037_1 /TAXON_ID=91992 /ORGANISM="Bolidomonas pacifica, Strain CCMP 1866" /LENGTH=79 /DNA_ID=CAMNT_0006546393 /DNA_START=105 /DNA_END=344 /DNA_ORIENTATION=-